MGSLTSKTVEKLAKAAVAGLTNAGDGLYFKVGKTGGTSWIFRFKIAGKSRDMGLGRYPEVGLAEARDKATEARKLAKTGTDPLAVRDAEREARRAAQQAEAARAVTFREVAASYIAAHRAGWKNAKHAQQWENTLATYAHPTIGALPAQDVTTAHVLEILQPIWTTNPETASRVRNRIELVLDRRPPGIE